MWPPYRPEFVVDYIPELWSKVQLLTRTLDAGSSRPRARLSCVQAKGAADVSMKESMKVC